MNTRKANFKKLRLPSTDSSDSRNGRRKATISNFFSTEASETNGAGQEMNEVVTEVYSQPMPSPIEKREEEEPPAKAKRAPRTKLSTFLPKEKRMKPAAEKPISDFLTKIKSDDFETPDKTIKKAPKTKAAKPRPKRQQKIKTAFLKNEELFTAVTAQHCLVDNINPDEMQMALALSMSEANASGVIALDDDESKEGKEDIRDKLKTFGFRVAESEDYTFTAFMPTKKKTKWANKFTVLTLRNPARQLEKVHQKVEEFLSTQFLSSDSAFVDETLSYSVKSEILSPLVARDRTVIRPDPNERLGVVDFYVLSLFEPSRTRAGHLLKDVRCIAGRDISPKKIRPLVEGDRLDPQLQSPAMKKSRYEEILNYAALSLPCTSRDSDCTATLDKPLPATISCFSNYDSKLKTFTDQVDPVSGVTTTNYCDYVDSRLKLNFIEIPSILNDSNAITTSNNCDNTESIPELSSTESATALNDSISKETSTPPLSGLTPQPLSSIEHLSTIRATSPDIFADSDAEMETDDCSEMEKLNVSKSSSSGHHITTYEIFSSDEVKTFSGTKNDSSDVNHNQLTTVIDLTQCESDTNSQFSDKLILSIPIQSYQENRSADISRTTLGSQLEAVDSASIKSFKEADNLFPLNGSFAEDLQTTSLMIDSQLEAIASTSFKSIKETDYLCNFNETSGLQMETMASTSSKSFKETDYVSLLNGSYSLEKSRESKRTCFSFGSSASEELQKSTSFSKSSSMQADDSIDLTQNSDDDGEYIVLSDDEINYSIRKADKSLHVKEQEIFQNDITDYLLNDDRKNESGEKHEFSFVDLVANTQEKASQEFNLNSKTSSNTSLDSLGLDLSKRSDFGILEEQSPFKTPTKTPKKTPRKTPTSGGSTKCRRALSESFLTSPGEKSTLLKHFSTTRKFDVFTRSDDDSLSDLDDIDKLIYGSPSKRAYKKPAGLDQLLTGVISEKHDSPKKTEPESPKEFQFNGRTYLVRTTDVLQKPNYEKMDESAMLDQLYRYGLKPLKRKQAVKILEYVYNQTHPCLVDEGEIPSQSSVTVNGDDNILHDDNQTDVMPAASISKFNFKDCWGHVIVSDMDIQMEIEDEQYIVQTNTSKKISTALLPFHIAWYNLVKSNKQLHEAILHYEPVDLQEIYLFLKGIGYRYDPKELKYFFDSRSIIFRYDLNKDPFAGANRHIRKKRLGPTQRSGKNKIS